MDTQEKALKFSLGRIVTTISIGQLIHPNFIADLLERHHTGDWGDLDKEDIDTNEKALSHNNRLMSSYDTKVGKIWIITEADRSSTTILWPDEY